MAATLVVSWLFSIGSGAAVKVAVGAEKQSEPAAGAVVPAGREELLADMLGRGASLPGGCQFKSGEVEYSLVKGVYACPAGEVVVELMHPSEVPPSAATTDRFALTVSRGGAPDGLVDALVARIRAREAEFEWDWISAPEQQSSPLARGPLIVGLLMAVAVLGFVLRRRRRVSGER